MNARGSFLGVLRYEWQYRRAWKNRRALLRGWWWTFVRRYETELCEDCGRPVGLVWTAPDEWWQKLVGSPAGCLCPHCFDRRYYESARLLHGTPRAGIVRWVPFVEYENEHDPNRARLQAGEPRS